MKERINKQFISDCFDIWKGGGKNLRLAFAMRGRGAGYSYDVYAAGATQVMLVTVSWCCA